MLLVDGNKVKQDAIAGRQSIEKAAKQGDKSAQSYLAGIYRLGMSVPVDTKRALSMYQTLCNDDQETAYFTAKEIEERGK